MALCIFKIIIRENRKYIQNSSKKIVSLVGSVRKFIRRFVAFLTHSSVGIIVSRGDQNFVPWNEDAKFFAQTVLAPLRN